MRYKYISRVEVVESDDPRMFTGMEYCMLGKITDKTIWRVDRDSKKLLDAKIKLLSLYTLPYLMTKAEAWEWFDKNIEELAVFNENEEE